MLEPVKPPDELQRVQELCGMRVLDTPAEERFDRITRTASYIFKVPIALISLVDSERQWFKSRHGLQAQETPRNISFCGHAILEQQALVVENALLDPRFSDNPLVTGDLGLRFYAGHPLRGPHGYRIGTLCLIDQQARQLSSQDLACLRDLAAWAETELASLSLTEAMALARSNEENLRQSQKLLQAVMDGTSAYVHLRDSQGRYLYINKEYERVFQVRQQDVLGKTLEEVFAPAIAARYRELEQQVLESGNANHAEVTVMMADGEHTYLVVRSPLYDEDGQIYGACGVGTDITEGKRLALALQELNQQLAATTDLQRAILNGANFSIISVDLQGIIQTFNAGAEKMLGYTAQEMLGLQTPLILHLEQELSARAAALALELNLPQVQGIEVLVAKAKLGLVDEHEWTYRTKDGANLPVMLSMTALQSAQNGVTGYVGIAYDLTERKRIESMKNEFISTVSHELRTPLTSIRGSIGLLAAGAVGEMPSRAKSLLDIAKSNCERLVRLINDILDIEKIESGNMRFVSALHTLRPLLEAALATIQPYAQQFQVNFELDVPTQDVYVNVDPDRLNQVLVNLLSNASKFSPAGKKACLRMRLQQDLVRVSVLDQGCGIAEEFRSRIFKKFAQADSSDTRVKGGTGLGLNICKAIIERMHGQIGFFSEPGKGSEFYFDLPVVGFVDNKPPDNVTE